MFNKVIANKLGICFLLGLYGGIVNGNFKPGDENDRSFVERIKHDPKYQRPHPYDRRQMKLTCLPLRKIIQAYGKPSIDYLSLDIEGAELQVLQSLDFNEIDIKVISIETNKIGIIFDGSLTQLDYLLRRNGYIKYAQLTIDALYVKKEILEKI